MAFCTDREEYLCFEDFVTGTNLDSLVSEGAGELYNGTTPEVYSDCGGGRFLEPHQKYTPNMPT